MDNQGEGTESSWFDLLRIKQLVRLMRDNDLSEIDMQQENSRLRLRRGTTQVVAAAPAPVPVAAAPAAPVPSTEPASAAKPAAASSSLTEIKCPIVGTFYAASSPDVEAFVKVGSRVNADSVVCIVEAMKVFNEIQAGCSGTIREILVENGAPVEYGQVLYRVEAG